MLSRLFCFFCYTFVAFVPMFAMKYISPLDYGLTSAKTGVERYYVLMKCHQDAVKNGYGISYKGINKIFLEIPSNPQSIPLPDFIDFANVEITVNNTVKIFFLFSKLRELKNVDVCPEVIDNGDYSNYPNLKNDYYLLVVEDKNPWSDRINYNEKAIRKDVIFIKESKSKCKPILTYNSTTSSPVMKYCSVSTKKKVIKNLRFIRTANSTSKTFLLWVNGEYNLNIENIKIVTPENDKEYADFVMYIENCVALKLKNIHINGTYSLERKVGYGVFLNNIYDLKVQNMYARSKWGVFGTHNLHKVLLKDCDINRFDIHTYGREVRAVNCKFSSLYNQFSSVYGAVVFEKCVFTDFIPMLIESSYNSYTPFDLVWKDCTFNLDRKHNYLMTLFGVPEPYNERPELRRKCLPNVNLQNCKVVLAADMDKWYLFKTGGVKYKDSFDYITDIKMKNVKVKGNRNAKFEISTEPLNTTSILNVRFKNSDIK